MGVVLPFVPVADRPHNAAIVRCQLCEKRYACIWPTATAFQSLECSGCHRIGTLVVVRDIPPETV